MIDNAANNFMVEIMIDSIKATIIGRRKWGWFFPSLFVSLFNGFCVLPLLGLFLMSAAQKYLPGIIQIIVLILLLGLYLIVLYNKLLETLEYIFDKETIEINEQSIKIERSGFLGFRTRKVYFAGNIKGFTTSFSFSERFSFLNRLPFTSSSLGGFLIWHGRGMRPFYNFGKGVAQSDAQNLIDIVYRKYPQYRYVGT